MMNKIFISTTPASDRTARAISQPAADLFLLETFVIEAASGKSPKSRNI
jgi:hypothetical protein